MKLLFGKRSGSFSSTKAAVATVFSSLAGLYVLHTGQVVAGLALLGGPLAVSALVAAEDEVPHIKVKNLVFKTSLIESWQQLHGFVFIFSHNTLCYLYSSPYSIFFFSFFWIPSLQFLWADPYVSGHADVSRSEGYGLLLLCCLVGVTEVIVVICSLWPAPNIWE